MAVNGYCNKMSCSDCTTGCRLDTEIPCSPDCNALTIDGKINIKMCLKSGCDEIRYLLNAAGKSDDEILAEYGESAPYPYF